MNPLDNFNVTKFIEAKKELTNIMIIKQAEIILQKLSSQNELNFFDDDYNYIHICDYPLFHENRKKLINNGFKVWEITWRNPDINYSYLVTWCNEDENVNFYFSKYAIHYLKSLERKLEIKTMLMGFRQCFEFA